MGSYIGYVAVISACGLFFLLLLAVGLALHFLGKGREKKEGAKVRVRSLGGSSHLNKEPDEEHPPQ